MTIAVAAVGTLVCVGITGIFTKLRVEHKDEIIGLDAAEHGCVVFKNLAHFCYLKPLEIKSARFADFIKSRLILTGGVYRINYKIYPCFS